MQDLVDSLDGVELTILSGQNNYGAIVKGDACRFSVSVSQLPVQSLPDVRSIARVSSVRISHASPVHPRNTAT